MFRNIRRKEKELTAEECKEVLLKAEYGTLATMGNDGYPYAVPFNYIFFNDNIYFHCAPVGHKLDNIAHCSNVSFNVVTDIKVIPLIIDSQPDNDKLIFNGFDTNFNSVTTFGKTSEVFEKEKLDGLKALLKRFLNEDEYMKYKEVGIKYIEKSLERTKLIKIDIEHMTGKRGIKKNNQIQGKQQ